MAADFSLGNAELGTSVSLAGLEKGLGDAEATTRQKSGGFGDIFGNAFAFATGGLIAKGIETLSGAVTGFFSGAIGDAREATGIMAQTEAVIRSTGGAAGFSAQQIADMASSLSAASGRSLFGDADIQRGQNLLLTFTEIKDTLPDATSTMVDMAQAMGTDVKAQAIALGKALNDPIKGVTALSRVGVSFTDQQKAQIETMQKAGDMAGAQRIILAELNKEFGGSAAAAAAADGGWAQFNDRMGEAAESIGTALLPLLGMLGSFLTDTVAPAIETVAGVLADWLSDPATVTAIQGIADAIGTTLADAFAFLTTDAIPTLLAAWALIEPAVSAVLPLFQEDMPSVMATTGGSFQELQGIVDAVMGALEVIISTGLAVLSEFWHAHGAEITTFLQETWATIGEIVDLAVELINATIVPAFQAIAQFLSDHKEEIVTVLSAAWTIIKSTIDIAVTAIKGILTAALQIIQGDWSGAWETIKQTFSRIWDDIEAIAGAAVDLIEAELSMAWDAIKGGVQSAWDGIKGAVSNAVDDLVDVINDLPGMVAGVGRAVVQAIWDGMKAKWDELVEWFERKLQEMRDKLPFSEPKDTSSPFFGLSKSGEALVEALQSGIMQAQPLSVPALAPIGGGFGGGMSTAASSVGDSTTTLIFNIDARGAGMSGAEFERIVRKVVDESAREADVLTRTRR